MYDDILMSLIRLPVDTIAKARFAIHRIQVHDQMIDHLFRVFIPVLFLSLVGFVSPSLIFSSHREEAATHLPLSHQAFGGGVQVQGTQTTRGLR